MGALRSVFIGLGVTVLGLVFLTLLVGTTTYVAATPYVEREYPTVVLDEATVCSPACASPYDVTSFAVPAGANRVEASFTVTTSTPTGPLRVAVYDEDGRQVYNHVFAPPSAGVQVEQVSWAASEGTWTLVQNVGGFRGVVDIEIVTRGLPPGTL
jgi:hypothetical protein